MKLFILFIISEFQLFFCILRQCTVVYYIYFYERIRLKTNSYCNRSSPYVQNCINTNAKNTRSADLNLTRFMIVKSSGFRPIKDKLCFTVLYTKLRTIWVVSTCTVQYVRVYICTLLCFRNISIFFKSCLRRFRIIFERGVSKPGQYCIL